MADRENRQTFASQSQSEDRSPNARQDHIPHIPGNSNFIGEESGDAELIGGLTAGVPGTGKFKSDYKVVQSGR